MRPVFCFDGIEVWRMLVGWGRCDIHDALLLPLLIWSGADDSSGTSDCSITKSYNILVRDMIFPNICRISIWHLGCAVVS